MRRAVSQPGTPVLDDGGAAQQVLRDVVARLSTTAASAAVAIAIAAAVAIGAAAGAAAATDGSLVGMRVVAVERAA